MGLSRDNDKMLKKWSEVHKNYNKGGFVLLKHIIIIYIIIIIIINT